MLLAISRSTNGRGRQEFIKMLKTMKTLFLFNGIANWMKMPLKKFWKSRSMLVGTSLHGMNFMDLTKKEQLNSLKTVTAWMKKVFCWIPMACQSKWFEKDPHDTPRKPNLKQLLNIFNIHIIRLVGIQKRRWRGSHIFHVEQLLIIMCHFWFMLIIITRSYYSLIQYIQYIWYNIQWYHEEVSRMTRRTWVTL